MGKKILNALTNNLGFKIMALFLAVILWLVVYNTNDPDITKNSTATVVFENQERMAEAGLWYQVADSLEIPIRVTGKRDTLNSLSASDYKATADFENIIINEETGTAYIPLEFSSTRYNSSVKIKSDIQSINLVIENYKTESFVVRATTTGEVADGYALGTVSVSSPTSITLTGPQSAVQMVASVEAEISVDGISESMTNYGTLKYYDSDGNQITDNAVLDKLTPNTKEVLIAVEVLNTKSVAIVLSYSGTPPDGYSVAGIHADVERVTIIGSASDLNGISSIEIPSDIVNVSSATESFDTTVDITEYLPEGVRLANGTSAIITVSVDIEEYGSQTFTVPTDHITYNGLASGYSLEFSTANISVVVNGKMSAISQLSASQLTGSIDVSGLEPGTHTATVKFDVSSDDYSIESVTVTFVIREDSTSGGNDDDDDTTTGDTN